MVERKLRNLQIFILGELDYFNFPTPAGFALNYTTLIKSGSVSRHINSFLFFLPH